MSSKNFWYSVIHTPSFVAPQYLGQVTFKLRVHGFGLLDEMSFCGFPRTLNVVGMHVFLLSSTEFLPTTTGQKVAKGKITLGNCCSGSVRHKKLKPACATGSGARKLIVQPLGQQISCQVTG